MEIGGVHYILPDQNRRRALFLSSIGQRNYAILHNMCLPDRPHEKPIPALVEILKNQFDPPGMTPANRLQFHGRMRRPNETVRDYIGALQAIAARCEFGEFLNDALRDQLICGIGFEETQRKLLGARDLTYQVARQTALQDEAVRTQSRLLAQATGVNAVRSRDFSRQSASRQTGKSKQAPVGKSNKSNPTPPASHQSNGATRRPAKGNRPKCENCLGYHLPENCPARSWTCYNCQKTGHIARKCRRGKARVNHTTTPEGDQESDEQPDQRDSDGDEDNDEAYINSLLASVRM